MARLLVNDEAASNEVFTTIHMQIQWKNIFNNTMKKSLIAFLTFIVALQGFAQEKILVAHDPRTELMSVLFYLAGAPEYGMSQYASYRREIDAYFAPYEELEAVKFARELRKQHIGYDAVMYYAMKLSWNDKLTLSEDILPDPSDRWTDKDERKMLSLLNKFVKKTDFVAFYVAHEEFYSQVNAEMQKIVDMLDVQWFDRFFEYRDHKNFSVITSIVNGPQNYSVSLPLKSGEKNTTVVIGGCTETLDERPTFVADNVLPLLVHEFCHAYCNDLNSAHWLDMDGSVGVIFEDVQQQMRSMAYSRPKIMMDETLVRSSVINYMMTHDALYDLNGAINEETQKGFLMTRKMVDLLSRRNLSRYPTMESYMPLVVNEVNAFDLAEFRKDNDAKCAHLIGCTIEDGSTVDAGLKTLVLTFDKQMDGNIKLYEGKNGERFPGLADRTPPFVWGKNSTQLTLYLALKPDTEYGFCVHQTFTNAQGYPLDKNYYFSFRTR